MKNDTDIYNELAHVLINNAPQEAIIIKLKFLVKVEFDTEESGMNEFFFDYIDGKNVENWFGINDGRIVSRIGNLCLALREQMKQSEQGVWSAFNLAIDLKVNKFSADFEYQD
jgi:hypothetical protein